MTQERWFNTLIQANAIRNAQWDPRGEISLAFRGIELGGECGEALNVMKKLERQRMGHVGSRATKEDLGKELADVVICAYLSAMTAGIVDFESVIADKFNEVSERYGLDARLRRPCDRGTI